MISYHYWPLPVGYKLPLIEKSLNEMKKDTSKSSKYNFLTNGGESFDSFKYSHFMIVMVRW